jgi:hypothetical protein
MKSGVATFDDNEDSLTKDATTATREPTFSQWAYFEREMPGVIGRVCRWIHADCDDSESCWPHRARTIDHMVNHLRRVHDGDKDAPLESELRDAYGAYLRALQRGDVVPKRRGGIPSPPDEEKARHRGYLLKPRTIRRIKDIAIKLDGISQGDVIERLVDAEYERLTKAPRSRSISH